MKKHYLLLIFPTIYFTPLHELVHVLIASLFNVTVLKIDWWEVTLLADDNYYNPIHLFLQKSFWDSYFIMTSLGLLCIICFIYYVFKDYNVRFNIRPMISTNKFKTVKEMLKDVEER